MSIGATRPKGVVYCVSINCYSFEFSHLYLDKATCIVQYLVHYCLFKIFYSCQELSFLTFVVNNFYKVNLSQLECNFFTCVLGLDFMKKVKIS
jgi:hypothetical protein